MKLSRIFARRSDPAATLYAAIVAAARQPKAYVEWGVPDTTDGRFDMIILHQFLALERLKEAGPAGEGVMQGLTDAFFKDMDRSLREMGVGDLSVGKKVRRMAEAYHGRMQAYSAAVPDGVRLADALKRNIFAGVDGGKADLLAHYALDCAAYLRGQGDAALLQGRITFS
jgi:cytochrome b pre-mRNA-processing protein 3